ncbi:MAG: hypothetical protein IKO61_02680 [Lachnospiraceae bacterium]|nr:hypothetical protein [Lachnospiraceae bacterium]
MNNKKIVYLVNLLTNEVEGKENELMDIYKRAVEADEDYVHLIDVLSSYVFYRGEGKLLLEEGNTLLKEIMEKPHEGIDTLRKMRQLTQKIEAESNYFDTVIRRPNPALDQISVLNKAKLRSYNSALDGIASSIMFILLMTEGYLGIKTLFYADDYTMQDRLNAINNDFLVKLLRSKRMPSVWAIKRRFLKSEYSFTDIEYVLTGMGYDEFCSLRRQVKMKRINANVYMNGSAFRENAFEIPIYIGIGRIISEEPSKCLPMIKGGVMTDFDYPALSLYKSPIPVMDEMLKRATGGSMYVLEPERVVDLMNQWESGYNINRRRAERRCLLCGNYLDRGLACPSHFVFTRGGR